MSAVLRWSVPVDDEPHTFPLTGAVLYVDCRDLHAVDMWTLDSGGPAVDRSFLVVGTGHPLPEGARYVGTGLTPPALPPFANRGDLVWHLVEMPTATASP